MTDIAFTAKAGWKFDNSYAQLPQLLFTRLDPTPVRKPQLAVLNAPLAAALGLDAEALASPAGAAVLAGSRVPEGAEPLAQAYAGHQFGYFNKLGDGRALLLGEQLTPAGERLDIQLKGSGRTPYSRGGDGRAALGPMLREYIISEAMHALGIPTTRSLAVTTTGEPVYREVELPGAVLTRVAASHVRVGTFQYAAQWGGVEELRALADYTLQRHYPACASAEHRYLALLEAVMQRQAALIAQWMQVGFIHGVMNTDNMALSGETIDYGPCAFMDAYDPETVFSSIDRQGRYAYGNQPYIAAWNVARLAEALLPLLDEDREAALQLAQEKIERFGAIYQGYWLSGMRAKLGLHGAEDEDEALVGELLELMRQYRADYTNTFRALTLDRLTGELLFETPAFVQWRERWTSRLEREQTTREAAEALMRSSNPAVIPRNHRVEAALEAAEQDDYSVMDKLLAALAQPFAYTPEQEAYAELPLSSGRPYRTYCGT
ncbi:YdiU family protein [Paenibacillus athensensis]|uniref:Protein nucleotidyltransferase YdiU n=1 Tax=Paenibacillus athensensis TaxID=1967502 RepID=A0A4Y8Q8V8_9BACL|nr:YdiU family protein [Paenibacillus athensensis]MCD1260154.1 YdiU family protein [Paenibacillus athensensis]